MSLYAYCTLTEAKRHLRIVDADTYNDDYIQTLIYAASEAVKNYIGDKSAYQFDADADDEPIEKDSNYEPVLQSFGSETKAERVRPVVKHAVLLLVGEYYRNREGEGNATDPDYLPDPVRALLYPIRRPSAV